MRRLALFALFLLAATAVARAEPAIDRQAIVERAITVHIEPAYRRLAAAMSALEAPAARCDAEGLQAGYHDAYDAWMRAQHIAFGPVEAESRRFAILFWPDTKGFVRKSLDRLIAEQDPTVENAERFAKLSVAVRGLSALERLLFDDAYGRSFDGAPGAYRCRLAQAIARDLSRNAAAILAEWRGDGGYAQLMLSAGAARNQVYFSPEEPVRDLFTSLDAGLQSLADLRLGRPLGSFSRPRPNRTEAWRSGRSMRNVRLSIAALRELFDAAFADALSADDRSTLQSGFDRALVLSGRAPTPMRDALVNPSDRLAIEALQARLRQLQESLRQRLAPALGVSLGFNSMDGD